MKIKTVPVAAKNDLLACCCCCCCCCCRCCCCCGWLLVVAGCLSFVGCCWWCGGCWSLMKLIVIYFSTILKVAADLSTFDFGVNCWILEVFSRNALMEIQGVEVKQKYGKTLRLGSHCLHFLPSYTNCTCAGS